MKRRIFLFFLIGLINFSPIIANPVIHSINENRNTIGLYEKLELTIDLTASFSNPYDPEDVCLRAMITSPSSRTYIVDGFYYQDYIRQGPPEVLTLNGSPVWKVRFAPNEIGTWSYMISCGDGTGTDTSNVKTFDCRNSPSHGFLRRANSNYLKFDDGTQYFAIGQNIGWYGINKTYDYQTWLDHLADNGGNYIRLWMCSWAFAIEWKDTGLGNYSNRQDRAFQLDWVIEHAQQKEVYIQLCLNYHGQVSTNVNAQWNDNPYNISNGGPCSNTWDFFTNTTAKEFYKRRMRYIIARWGYATSILSWEFFNEIDWTDDFENCKTDVVNWHSEMAQYVRYLDIYDHLITTSYAQDIYDPDAWNLPIIDYTQIHHYNSASDVQSIHHDITQRYLSDYSKPVIISEFGFHDGSQSSILDPEGIDLHNCLWASMVSGSFGTTSIWWWDNYIEPQNLYYHYKALSEFISAVDLLSQEFSPIIPQCNSAEKVDLNISPGYTIWGKPPESDFTIYHNGSISPSASNLGKYLFGAEWNTQYRNPPTFHVNYLQPSGFKVSFGSASPYAPLPRIQITVDGVLVFDQVVDENSTYSINVDSGGHEIFIDNRGTDWIEISDFVFEDYVDGIRSFALFGDTQIIGWVQSRNYNWKYLGETGVPSSIDSGTITISGLTYGGDYLVEWYNCTTGDAVLTDTANALERVVTVVTPVIEWDYAYKITYIGEANMSSSGLHIQEQFKLEQNYPNPFNPTTNLKYDLAKDSHVSLVIYDILGREVRNLVSERQQVGTYRIVWDGKDNSGISVTSGVYLYKIRTSGYEKTEKMLFVK